MPSSTPWKPSFGVYHAWAEESDDVVFVTVDRGAAAFAGDPSHQVMLQVELPIASPTPDGLPTRAERPRLDLLEKRVKAYLERERDAWFVGRTIYRGSMRLVFYLANASLVGSGLFAEGPVDRSPWLLDLDAIGEAEGVSHWAAFDPEWTELDNLMPNAFQEQLIASSQVVWELGKRGDQPSQARQIDHVALFDHQAQAAAAASTLTERGFQVDAIGAADDRWSLEFSRVDTLQGVRIERSLGQILEAIEPHGGTYDGWGAPITPAPVAAELPRGRLFRRRT